MFYKQDDELSEDNGEAICLKFQVTGPLEVESESESGFLGFKKYVLLLIPTASQGLKNSPF